MSAQAEVVAGRYRLLERIGSGGMGEVWLAWDERLSRAVALKQLRSFAALPEEEAAVARARAMREARITARLHHPNSVPVFDVVDHDGGPCLVMQYLPSRSLHEVLAADGTCDPREGARIGAGIAAALAAAHDAGIVHRDVKPGNILLATDGTPLLTDFGISRASGDAALTTTGMLTGTPAYLAPEVARGGDPTPAADVFALGATLFAAVEGEPPFGADANPMALLHRVASGEVAHPRRAGALAPTLRWMLAPEADGRPSAAEAATALAAVAAGRGDTVPVTRPFPAVTEGSRGHTVVLPADPEPPEPARPGVAAPRTRHAEPIPEPIPDPVPARVPERIPETVPGPAPGGPPRRDGRRRRRAAAVAGALVLALVVVVALLVREDAPATVGPAPSSTSSGPTAQPSSATTSPSASTSRPTSATPSSPTAAPPTATPSRTATPRPAGAPTAAELASALRGYYDLLPDDTDAGWALLTARYRSTTSTNRATYERFWDSIARVRVGEVSATAPSSVVATLRYDFEDGRTFVERTAYTLVRDGGRLKIDRSSVLSSRQL